MMARVGFCDGCRILPIGAALPPDFVSVKRPTQTPCVGALLGYAVNCRNSISASGAYDSPQSGAAVAAPVPPNRCRPSFFNRSRCGGPTAGSDTFSIAF